MRLAPKWLFGHRKDKSCSLDVVPLKKVVAVGDNYWDEMYAPLIEVVSRCFSVFGNASVRLSADYVDQLVTTFRKSKGVVLDDPLKLHVQIYALTVCFSSLYLSRIFSQFEIHAISDELIKISKNNEISKGERIIIFPWVQLPEKHTIKVKKVRVVPSSQLFSLSIYSFLICSKIAWVWIHQNFDAFKGLIDGCASNGEVGLFTELLSGMKVAPLVINDSLDKQMFDNSPVNHDRGNKAEPEESQSLDELINSVSDNIEETPSIEELLNGSNNESDVVNKSKEVPDVTESEIIDSPEDLQSSFLELINAKKDDVVGEEEIIDSDKCTG